MATALKPLYLTDEESEAVTKLAKTVLERIDVVKGLKAELERVQTALPEASQELAAAQNKLMGAFEMICRAHHVDPDTMVWSIEGGTVSMGTPTFPQNGNGKVKHARSRR